MALTEYIEWMLKYYKYSPITIRNYLSQINLLLRHYPQILTVPNEEKLKLAREFVLNENIGKKRIRNKYFVLRTYAVISYLKFLNVDQMEINATFKKIGRTQKRENLATATYAQTIALVEELKRQNKLELQLILCLLWDSAARIRAILTMRKENIFVDDDQTYVLYLTEKRGQRIKKYITEDTYRLLQTYIATLPATATYLFFPNTDKLSDEELQKKYQDTWSDLKNTSRHLFGGMGMSAHWFRRGRAYKILKDTHDIIKAQTVLGHKSLDSTRIYLEADAEELKNIIRKEKRPW